MTIEEDDFRLTSVSDFHWDLELKRTVRPRGGPEREEMQLVGYGYLITKAIQIIANYRIEKRHPEAINMKEYLNELKKEFENLAELCDPKIKID